VSDSVDLNVYDKKKLMSDFNEAGFQILRLHESWQNTNTKSSRGDLDNWKWTLDSIWRELAADFTDDKKVHLKIKVLNHKIGIAKTKDQLYWSLDKKHIFLKELQEAAGKGGKKSADYHNDSMMLG